MYWMHEICSLYLINVNYNYNLFVLELTTCIFVNKGFEKLYETFVLVTCHLSMSFFFQVWDF